MFCGHKNVLILIYAPILASSLTTSDEQSPRVTFSLGTVEGLEVRNPMGKKIEAFLGIPFGEAPLGKWRFRPPRPARPWTGILQAKKASIGCYQKISTFFDGIKEFPMISRFVWFEAQSEDCLTLNVWRPKIKDDKKLPVLVWIHGGGFLMGSAAVEGYGGDVLVAEEEVLLVVMNYRVGPLGFMFLGTPDVPGNAGMHDQLLALKWVKKNIAEFGGDPSKITLFGQSAGSASVGYHMLSPLTSGLFHRAILQSGVPNADWAYKTNQKMHKTSMDLAALLGCKSENLSAVVECLQVVPALDIIAKESLPFPVTLETLAFVPTKDGSFLTYSPDDLLNSEHIRKVDIVIGGTENDASLILASSMPFGLSLADKVNSVRSNIKTMMDIHMPEMSETVKRLALTEYNDWTDADDSKTVGIAEKLITDYTFFCPGKRFAETLLKMGRKVFKYVLSHRTSNNPAPKWCGVVHCEDLLMVFGSLLYSPDASTGDSALARTIMRYWGNFAKYGDPNGIPGQNRTLPQWTEYRKHDENILVLQGNSSYMGTKKKEKFCAIWNKMAHLLDNKGL